MPTKTYDELEAMVGWQSSAFCVELEHGRIEAFAEAVHDDDPVFTDQIEAQARGLADTPTPVTFFASLFFVDQDIHGPDLGFRAEDKLHGEQHFEFERTPVAGETLAGKTTLADVTQKEQSGGGTLTIATLETDYHDEDGELVLTARKVVLEVSDQ
jgi:acyl dehydratase